MAEWAHYSLPNTEWTEAVKRIGGIPSLFKGTDLLSWRKVFDDLLRERVEGAGGVLLGGGR